ncbi:MAG: HAMP domain-containing histidine kinase [Flavobacterium sp.]|nr:MAG: HAMP domain-containing histidine kinase [Flavobacterium sp.]
MKSKSVLKLTKKHLLSAWNNIIGDKADFSLEARIFHAVAILAVFTASINMIINFWIGLMLYGFIVIPLLGILLLGYYLSKYRNKLNLAVAIFAIAFNFLCGATYFSSEGSESVNLFTFILIIFLLSFLTSKKQFRIWIPITILHVSTLFVLEYFYPDLAKPLYSSRQNKLIDVAQTWIEVAGMIAIITMYIQHNYNSEKELAKSRLVALEEINDTKNKLFSIVAHDLRAPLASIENYLSILSKVDLSPDEKKSIEQTLLASTKQTSEMLQNILYWSKDQMLGITPNLVSVNLNETLGPTILMQQTLSHEKKITLTYLIAPTIHVIADVDMLQLIVRNLLNNAIKFSSPGGEIKLFASLENDKCLIQISDTGTGIHENDEADIFSIKYKGNYGTNKEKGVGLGLILAKTYIELQNGEIWYKNNPTIGTTFFISLPNS